MTTESPLDVLAASVFGDVIKPGDAEYDSARQVWNGMVDKKPAVIVRCLGTADVIEAVKYANAQGLPVAARCGSHNVAGTAIIDKGVVVDLTRMRGVMVDPKARKVKVQGGCLWKDVDRETQLHGLATPSGLVSATGVAGFTLGGGYGHLRRLHGMTCDNLIGADVVTGTGELVHCSADENPDLLWALRGGGGNFGVVVNFEFALHDIGPEIYLSATFYPLEEARQVVRGWQEFMKTAPNDLSSHLIFWSIPPGFPEEIVGKAVVGVPSLWPHKDVAEGEKLTAPLRKLGTPVVDLSSPMPYTAAQSAFDPFFPHQALRYYWKAIDLDEVTEPVLDLIVKCAQERPTSETLIALWHFGGAMNRPEPTDTAFWRRNTNYMLSFDCTWPNASDDEKCVSWARNAIQSTRPLTSGGEYVNFAGMAEDGEAQARAAYGDNYDKLVAAKRKYDPKNLFRSNVNIAP